MDYSTMSIEDLTEFCTREYKEISIKEKQLDKAKEVLFAKMSETNVPEVKSPFGRFYVYERTVYTFPEDIIALKNTVAQAEERAKAEGRVFEKKITSYKFGELKKGEGF